MRFKKVLFLALLGSAVGIPTSALTVDMYPVARVGGRTVLFAGGVGSLCVAGIFCALGLVLRDAARGADKVVDKCVADCKDKANNHPVSKVVHIGCGVTVFIGSLFAGLGSMLMFAAAVPPCLLSIPCFYFAVKGF